MLYRILAVLFIVWLGWGCQQQEAEDLSWMAVFATTGTLETGTGSPPTDETEPEDEARPLTVPEPGLYGPVRWWNDNPGVYETFRVGSPGTLILNFPNLTGVVPNTASGSFIGSFSYVYNSQRLLESRIWDYFGAPYYYYYTYDALGYITKAEQVCAPDVTSITTYEYSDDQKLVSMELRSFKDCNYSGTEELKITTTTYEYGDEAVPQLPIKTTIHATEGPAIGDHPEDTAPSITQMVYTVNDRGLVVGVYYLDEGGDVTGWTIYEYDHLGRVAQRKAPSGLVSDYTYDDAGRLILVTDDLSGFDRDFAFDGDGLIVQANHWAYGEMDFAY